MLNILIFDDGVTEWNSHGKLDAAKEWDAFIIGAKRVFSPLVGCCVLLTP